MHATKVLLVGGTHTLTGQLQLLLQSATIEYSRGDKLG